MTKKNNLINILYLDPAPFMGGTEIFSLDIFKNLSQQTNFPLTKTKIFVACDFNQEYQNKLLKIIKNSKNPHLEIINHPLKIPQLKPINLKNIEQFLESTLAVKNLIKKEKIDIIYSNKVRSHILTGFLNLNNFRKKRLIWYIHDFTFNTLLAKFLSLRVDLIFANSKAIANFTKKQLFPWKRKNVKILPNGVEINPNTFQEKKVNPQKIVIGTIGRVDRWKGYEYIVKSAPLVLKKFPQTHFKIMGWPSEKDPATLKYWEKLQKLKTKLNLTDKQLEFTGWVNWPLKNINSLDIFIHSSITPEPFGRVIIEAMSLKKACIASNLGGPKDIIQNGINGFLIKPAKEKLLAEKLIYLIENPKIRKQFGKRAYQKVLKKYDNNIVGKKLLEGIIGK